MTGTARPCWSYRTTRTKRRKSKGFRHCASFSSRCQARDSDLWNISSCSSKRAQVKINKTLKVSVNSFQFEWSHVIIWTLQVKCLTLVWHLTNFLFCQNSQSNTTFGPRLESLVNDLSQSLSSHHCWSRYSVEVAHEKCKSICFYCSSGLYLSLSNFLLGTVHEWPPCNFEKLKMPATKKKHWITRRMTSKWVIICSFRVVFSFGEKV